MKKNFIIPLVVFFIFSSCKKEDSNLQSEQVASTENRLTTNSAADPTMSHFTVDVTGLTFYNGCTGEDMLITSGVFSLNTHQDGTIASYNVHDFVLQAADGSIYRGNWVGTFQLTAPLPDPGALTNTYKVILTTAGGDNNFLLQGVFHITENANGEFAVVIDNFTASCK